MDERPDPAAVADDRQAALPDDLGDLPRRVDGERGPGPVETAVAEGEAVEAVRVCDRVLDVANRRKRLGDRPRRVLLERVRLGLHKASHGLERPAGEALSDEAPRADRLGRRKQVIGSLGAQPVGLHKGLVDVSCERAGECGELVDDCVGLGLGHHLRDPLGIEGVRDHRACTHRGHHFPLRWRAGHARDFMALVHEHRHELFSERPGGAGYEDPHVCLLSISGVRDGVRGRPVTAGLNRLIPNLLPRRSTRAAAVLS
jgi:hypothetical protein